MFFRLQHLVRPFYSVSRMAHTIGQQSLYAVLEYEWLYLFDCLSFLYGEVRFALTAYYWLTGLRVRYDVWSNLLAGTKVSHLYIPAIFMLGCAFMFSLPHTLYHLPRCLLTDALYEMVVLTQDAYFQLKLSSANVQKLVFKRSERNYEKLSRRHKLVKFMPFFALKYYCVAKAKVQVWVNLENVDRVRLFQSPLKVMINTSTALRERILLLSLAFDAYGLLAIVIYHLFVVSLLAFLLPSVMPYLTMYNILLLTLDGTLAYCAAFQVIRFALFFFTLAVLGTIFCVGHLNQQTKELVGLINQCRKYRILQRYFLQTYQAKIDQFLGEHHRISFGLMQSSDKIFSQLIVIFLVAVIPINVYLLRLVLLKNIQVFEYFAYLLIAILQLGLGGIFLLALAIITSTIHQPSKYIVPLQSMLGANSIRYKLKFDNLLYRLVWGRKIAATVGPIKEITFRVILEIVVFYFGFLLLVFSNEVKKID